MIIGELSRIAVQRETNSRFIEYDSIFCNKNIGFNGLITSKSWRHFTLTTKNEFESFLAGNSSPINEKEIFFNLLLNVNVAVEALFEKPIQIGSTVILELTDFLDGEEISGLIKNATATDQKACSCSVLYGRIVRSGRLQIHDRVRVLSQTITHGMSVGIR